MSEFVIMEDEPPPEPEVRPGNQLINYQGRLLDGSGAPITGSVITAFSLYETESGDTVIWAETQALSVDQGIYHVLLGGVSPFTPDVFSRAYLYLGVRAGADTEMTPRQQITSVPSALTIDGQRIERGAATLTVSASTAGTANITFATPFSSRPHVTISGLSDSVDGKAFVLTKIAATPDGFIAEFQSLSGLSATGGADFDWMAVGE